MGLLLRSSAFAFPLHLQRGVHLRRVHEWDAAIATTTESASTSITAPSKSASIAITTTAITSAPAVTTATHLLRGELLCGQQRPSLRLAEQRAAVLWDGRRCVVL